LIIILQLYFLFKNVHLNIEDYFSELRQSRAIVTASAYLRYESSRTLKLLASPFLGFLSACSASLPWWSGWWCGGPRGRRTTIHSTREGFTTSGREPLCDVRQQFRTFEKVPKPWQRATALCTPAGKTGMRSRKGSSTIRDAHDRAVRPELLFVCAS